MISGILGQITEGGGSVFFSDKTHDKYVSLMDDMLPDFLVIFQI